MMLPSPLPLGVDELVHPLDGLAFLGEWPDGHDLRAPAFSE